MYDKIIALGKFYSDLYQTPQARKMWIKLFSKYKVMGYSELDHNYFKVKLVGSDIVSADSKYILYTKYENENTNRSVAM